MTQVLHQLTIQVSLQKFSFVIRNEANGAITFFGSEALNQNKTIEEQLTTIFKKYESLKSTYSNILVLHDSNLNTFVPTALFDENALGLYLQYNTKVFANDFFAFDELSTFGMNNVYVPFVQINNFLFDQFGTFTYHNINTYLVEHILTQSSDFSEKEVYAYVQKDHFEIVVAQDRKLLFFNSFLYNTAQDFIYYLLFVYEQLNLDTEETKLKLISRVDKDDALYKEAYTYIRHLEILEATAVLNADLLLHYQVPKQHYILFHL